jgi:CheY-like chemotaxis protein
MSEPPCSAARELADTNIIVADDNALIRCGLKLVVQEMLGNIRVVEVANGLALLNAARTRESFCLAFGVALAAFASAMLAHGEGAPVLEGEKRAATKWLRERAFS